MKKIIALFAIVSVFGMVACNNAADTKDAAGEAESLLDAATDAVGGAADAATDAVEGAVDATGDAVEGATDAAGDAVEGATDAVKEGVKKVEEAAGH